MSLGANSGASVEGSLRNEMTVVHNLTLLNGDTSGRLGKFGLTSVNSSQDWYVELAEGDNLPRSVILV